MNRQAPAVQQILATDGHVAVGSALHQLAARAMDAFRRHTGGPGEPLLQVATAGTPSIVDATSTRPDSLADVFSTHILLAVPKKKVRLMGVH